MSIRKTWRLVALGLALMGLVRPEAAAALDPVNETWRGVALQGFDPVAYFHEGRPVEGRSEFSTEWMGATWRFASAGNRELFVARPLDFAPQYGGYCAYAVAMGDTANIDPEAWRIVDGKLYLNYDKAIQKLWEKDVRGFIARADANWPKLLRGE